MRQIKKKYKLEDITQIVSGGTPSTNIETYYNGNIPWITPKDLSGYKYKYITEGERSITVEGLNNSSAKMVPQGTVLFSSRAPIGYTAIAGVDLCTNQGFKNFICDEKNIHNEYLYYYLIQHKGEIEKLANGSTFKELSVRDVKDIEINIPNIEIQKSIVRKLSFVKDKIELNLQIIDSLHKLSEQLYIKYFERDDSAGDFRYLCDMVEIISGGTPKTTEEEYWIDGNIEWFTPSDITSLNSLFVSESNRKITEKGFIKSSAKKVPKYSVLMTSRATIGELAINTVETTTNQGIMSFVPNNTISLYQLYFWIKRNKNLIVASSNGSTFKEVSKSELKKMKIFVPDEPQIAFIRIVEMYFKQIEMLIQENRLLNELLNQLMNKLF